MNKNYPKLDSYLLPKRKRSILFPSFMFLDFLFKFLHEIEKKED